MATDLTTLIPVTGKNLTDSVFVSADVDIDIFFDMLSKARSQGTYLQFYIFKQLASSLGVEVFDISEMQAYTEEEFESIADDAQAIYTAFGGGDLAYSDIYHFEDKLFNSSGFIAVSYLSADIDAQEAGECGVFAYNDYTVVDVTNDNVHFIANVYKNIDGGFVPAFVIDLSSIN